MKKNISINIFGTVYAIDEDAYLLLDNYLQGMKNYFHSQEGGDEIADDIEHRVAELLWEYKEQGLAAVDISMVKAIIEKIGNPAEIDDDDAPHTDASSDAGTEVSDASAETSDASSGKGQSGFFARLRAHAKNHRMYRNMQDKMLGGVCSGLAEYAGTIDVTIWRLGTVLLAILMWSPGEWWWPDWLRWSVPLLYLALWIILPEARTPEDRLRMKGRTVNAENLKEQIVSESEEQASQAVRPSRHLQSGCLRIILGLLLLMLLLPLFATFMALVLVLFMFGFGISLFTDHMGAEVQRVVGCMDTSLVVAGSVAGIIVIGIPIWAIIAFLRQNRKPMSTVGIVSLILTWIVALGISIASAVLVGLQVQDCEDEQYDAACTRGGIRLGSPSCWRTLDEMGWTLESMENVEPCIIESRSGYAGLPPHALTIRRDTASLPMSISMQRQEYYDQGYYVLEMLSGTNGKGIGVEVRGSEDTLQPLASIVPSAAGKSLKGMKWEEGCTLPILSHPDSTEWEDFADDWSYFVSAPFHHKGGMVSISIKARNAYVNSFALRHIRLRPVEAPAGRRVSLKKTAKGE